jgi:membrane protein
MIRKWLRYLDQDLWNFRLSAKAGYEYFRLKWLRVFYLAIRGFIQDQCTLRASSLTYYTLISIVPVLAMTLAVAGGFGFRESLRDELLSKFEDQREALQQIIGFADQLLEQTRGGVIAGVGLLVLFWSVTALLNNMETTLNHIWGIKKMRSWRRILSDYFAFMLIAPIFFLVSSSATVFIARRLETLVLSLPIGTFLISAISFFLHLLPYALFWILFTFIFVFMPNTRVYFRSAFVGGLVTGTLYLLVQWGYIFFQVGVSRYGAIYGSFAALPLFLIWIQLSWFLVLFGAEVSYAHQTLESHEFGEVAESMSNSLRRLLCLWVAYLVVQRYIKDEGPLTHEALVKRYQIPHGVANRIAQELIDCKILLEVRGEKDYVGYVPARSPEELKISDVCEALDSRGTRDWPWIESKAWKHLEATLEKFQTILKSHPENKRLRDYEDE